MNIEEYEKKKQALYREFAETVRFIIERAISARDDLPRPQSTQSREKSPQSLRAKLEARGILDAANIDEEIRDLAGVRAIFYTNNDVERFNGSEIIRANFVIENVRVHHPTVENEGRQYRGFHYTVRLTPEREALPEYAKFAGMRCEIQVQTILNHAWSETTHDVLYKRPDSEGFGKRAFDAIERRMKRVMDDYLLPAGREIARAQHDYQRAMAGKDLFDRDALEALRASPDNNDRYDIIENFREYVLPNYDDLEAVFPEVVEVLLEALGKSRETPTKRIETPFGSYDGKNADDIARQVIRILEEWRYWDVIGVFKALIQIYRETSDGELRKQALTAVQRLSEYNIPVIQQVGYGVQGALVDELAKMPPAELAETPSPAITIWGEVLHTEMTGSAFAGDTVTISTGAVQPHESLSTVRRAAMDGLLNVLDLPVSEGAKRNALSALNTGTFFPHQGGYGDELCAIILDGQCHSLAEIRPRITALPFELRETLEHHLLYEYRRASGLASSERFGEPVKAAARTVVEATRRRGKRVASPGLPGASEREPRLGWRPSIRRAASGWRLGQARRQ